MAMTPKVAVVVLLVASLTAGCGASAEEKQAACWTTRQAINEEIALIEGMDPQDYMEIYRPTDNTVEVEGLDLWGMHQYWRTRWREALNDLALSLPDC
jgi:hypothetical protein